jgi:hypothetical protein
LSRSHAGTGKCWCGGSHSRIGAFLEDMTDKNEVPAPVAGQYCVVCGLKMDPKLVAKTGWAFHPNCEEAS